MDSYERRYYIFGRPLLGLYTSDSEVIEIGMLRIKVLMIAYFTAGIMNVFPGLTRGMGYSISPMMSTLIGACLMRIVWLKTVFKWYPTVAMLFACYPVTWLAGLGQVCIFFMHDTGFGKVLSLQLDMMHVS